LSKYSEATGVILTGGKSHRMGRDKLPLKVGDTTLLDRVISALTSHCKEILVVGEGGYTPAGTRRIPDLRPGEGPLAGIEAGLLAARYRLVFVAAGDMPFLTGGLVEYLLGLLSERTPAVVPVFGDGSHPLCAAYAREEVRPAVCAALDGGVRSVRELVEGLPGVRYVGEGELWRFGDPNLLLTNVNSPEDLARARAVLYEDAARGG
jgi:molybdopterin-guanine dinucleotide biosynthesis protein A